MAAHDDPSLRRLLRSLPVFDGRLPRLDVERAPDDPLALLRTWLLEAVEAGAREPHAMTLSTVDADGRPNSRVLILKGLDDRHCEFATSRRSRKGEELGAAPWVALNLYWRELGRQVRLRGRASDAGRDAARRDFLARSPAGRAESLAGRQSGPLARRADLEAALEDALARVDADPELVADDWAVYRVAPDELEFFQAAGDRRHIRLGYRLTPDGWTRALLWP